MKTAPVLAWLLLLVFVAGGCASAPSSGSGSQNVRCLSRPDASGTQPLIYFLCIQSG